MAEDDGEAVNDEALFGEIFFGSDDVEDKLLWLLLTKSVDFIIVLIIIFCTPSFELVFLFASSVKLKITGGLKDD